MHNPMKINKVQSFRYRWRETRDRSICLSFGSPHQYNYSFRWHCIYWEKVIMIHISAFKSPCNLLYFLLQHMYSITARKHGISNGIFSWNWANFVVIKRFRRNFSRKKLSKLRRRIRYFRRNFNYNFWQNIPWQIYIFTEFCRNSYLWRHYFLLKD